MCRYLQGEGYNFPKVLAKVRDHHQWRTSTFPMPKELWEPYINSGIFYAHKRDKYYRPVLVLNMSVACKLLKTHTGEQLAPQGEYFLTFVVEKLMLKAKAESWVMIIDLGNVNLVGFPVGAMKTIVGSAMLRFTGHLGKIFVVNATWTVKTVFNVVISLCDDFVKAKIKICDSTKDI